MLYSFQQVHSRVMEFGSRVSFPDVESHSGPGETFSRGPSGNFFWFFFFKMAHLVYFIYFEQRRPLSLQTLRARSKLPSPTLDGPGLISCTSSLSDTFTGRRSLWLCAGCCCRLYGVHAAPGGWTLVVTWLLGGTRVPRLSLHAVHTTSVSSHVHARTVSIQNFSWNSLLLFYWACCF